MAAHQFWDTFPGNTVEGKYRLQSLRGVGACGGVYCAEEVVVGRVIGQVAVKLIQPRAGIPLSISWMSWSARGSSPIRIFSPATMSASISPARIPCFIW